MARPLLDTSVFSTYIKQIEENLDSFHFSIVVFYELMASMIDVVTDNVRDYELLQKVMPNLEVIPAKEYFS